MLGYTKEDLNEMIDGLCRIEASPKSVSSINKAIDFLQGLSVEGYFNEP